MTLFLQFEIGNDGYVLEATQVACVLPLVDLKRIPHAPPGVAGSFNYHGTVIPVVDLSEIVLGRPAARLLSTRLILIPLRIDSGQAAGEERLLGLIAEQVTQTLRREPTDFQPSGIASHTAPYLGPVTAAGSRLLQSIDVRRLLPAEVRHALFQQVEQAGEWA
jgi:chemotaxis-related protein WspB